MWKTIVKETSYIKIHRWKELLYIAISNMKDYCKRNVVYRDTSVKRITVYSDIYIRCMQKLLILGTVDLFKTLNNFKKWSAWFQPSICFVCVWQGNIPAKRHTWRTCLRHTEPNHTQICLPGDQYCRVGTWVNMHFLFMHVVSYSLEESKEGHGPQDFKNI